MEKFKGKGLLKMLASPRGRGNSTSQPFGSTPAKDIADAEPALRDSEAKPTPTNSKIWGKLWGSRRSSESPRCSPGSTKVLGAAGAADDTMPLRVTPIRTAPADSSRDDVSDVADNDSHYSTPMLGGAASPGTSPLGSGMDQTLVLTPVSVGHAGWESDKQWSPTTTCRDATAVCTSRHAVVLCTAWDP